MLRFGLVLVFCVKRSPVRLNPGCVNMVNFLPILAYTEGDRWRPGIGDPTLMGWITVAAYFLGGFLCLAAALRVSGTHSFRDPERRFWLVLALALAFLGINKQLDLQTWLTLAGKRIAIAQGWYEQRRVVQGIFIAGIAAGGIFAVRWVWKNMRHAPGPNWVALAGLIFLGCFIVVRAASFHHVDLLLKSGPGGLRMNWVLELGGISMLGLAAMKRAKSLSDSRLVLRGNIGGHGNSPAPVS